MYITVCYKYLLKTVPHMGLIFRMAKIYDILSQKLLTRNKKVMHLSNITAYYSQQEFLQEVAAL